MATYKAYNDQQALPGTKQFMSDQDISQQIQTLKGDPAKLAEWIKQNGITRTQAAVALNQTGYNGRQDVQNYMDANKGFDPWGGNYGGKDAWVLQGINGTQAAPQTAQPTDRSNQGTPPNPYLPQAQAQAPVAQPTAQTQPTSQPTTSPNPATVSNPYQAPQNLGFGGSGYAQNPYTNMQAGFMAQNVGDMLSRSAMPAINQNAVQAGGVGGSRQGVAQGLAIGEATKGLAQGLGGLYSQNYLNDQNLGLQGDRLNLDVYNSNQNWMGQGQDRQVNFMDKLMNWNQQGLQNANQQQNTPMNYWQQFSNGANAAGGQGGTNSQQMPGDPWLGAFGGYALGKKMFGG